ncbi:MAG: NAD(P)/FAD-dependent oxidoreductase [Bacteroidota bacterium]
MPQTLSRRDLLRLGALSAGGLALAPFARAVSPPRRALRVVVVGAGVAGLIAAYELRTQGHEVTVLEAQMRSGGRILTVRDPFAEGLHAEMGAARIPENHDLTLRYARQFGLELDPFYPTSGAEVHLIQGQRVLVPHGTPPDYSGVDHSLDLGDFGSMEEVMERLGPAMGPAMEASGDVRTPGWPSPASLRYDGLSINDFLRQQGLSDDALDVLQIGIEPHSATKAPSALWVLSYFADDVGHPPRLKIQGGNDRLPAAFAAELAEHIHYGAPVVRIAQDDGGVRATVRGTGGQFEVEGDALVCTVPFPVLRRVEADPAFSPEKRRAINELHYAAVTRCAVQVRERYWDPATSGFGLTDHAAEVWHPSWDRPGARGILQSYMRGDLARRASGLDDDARRDLVLDQLEDVHPGIRDHAEGMVTKVWHEDEWAGGAHQLAQPGQFEAHFHAAMRPEGRVYFAGEHVSPWPGWIQGALHSGLRAVAEIIAD